MAVPWGLLRISFNAIKPHYDLSLKVLGLLTGMGCIRAEQQTVIDGREHDFSKHLCEVIFQIKSSKEIWKNYEAVFSLLLSGFLENDLLCLYCEVADKLPHIFRLIEKFLACSRALLSGSRIGLYNLRHLVYTFIYLTDAHCLLFR